MKIIINTTTVVMGGGLQVINSFLNELKEFGGDDYHVFLSFQVESGLDLSSFPDNFYFYSIDHSPASLKRRKSVLAYLDRLEGEINPDAVFTVFGPSYWKPQAPHLMGIAVGWCYNFDSVAWNVLSLKERLRMRLKVAYRNYYLKRDADSYVVETAQVKGNLERFLGFANDRIEVVSNTVATRYQNVNSVSPVSVKDGKVRIFVLSANYVHKNLKILKEVVPLLKEHISNFEFIVTLPEADFEAVFGKDPDGIINAGVLSMEDCISWYGKSDVLFLPTLLESFTVTYLESMAMRRPVVTTDLDFARSICGDAALFYSALSAQDAADKILKLLGNEELYAELIEKGLKRFRVYPTARNRAMKYVGICHQIAEVRK